MLNVKQKTRNICAAFALALVCSPAEAATITIRVGVDPAFAATASDLISAFQNYYSDFGLSYSVVLTAAPSSQLESDIVAGGATGPYDLLLAGSIKEPLDLALNYPGLIVGGPVPYAKDYLTLYSETVDISAGLPYPLTTNIVLPDPTQDIYGLAAASLLAFPPWRTTTIPSGYVFTRPNSRSAFAAIKAGNYAYGFVANSKVCSLDANGNPFYPAGSYHYTYNAGFNALFSAVLTLTGVKLAQTRTTDQETELSNFLSFLSAAADSAGNTTTAGTDILKGHCFKIPVL